MSTEHSFDSEADSRYEALLQMADLLVHHQSLPELFEELAEHLQKVTSSEFANFSQHDPIKNVMRLHLWEGQEVGSGSLEMAICDSPAGWAWQNQTPLIVSDLQQDERFPAALDVLRQKGLRSYCWLPVTTAQKRLGTLGLGSLQTHAYSAKDMQLLPRVAELVALAVENAQTREALTREKDRLQILLEVNNTLVTKRDLKELFPAISGFMQRMIWHEYASVAVYDESAHSLSIYPLDSRLANGLLRKDTVIPVKESLLGSALLERQTKIFNREDLLGVESTLVSQMFEQGIQSLCCIPLITREGTVGTLNLGSTQKDAFRAEDLDLLQQVAAQVAVAFDNARAYHEIAELTDRLAKENLYLESNIRTEMNFEEIVGESSALERVLRQAKVVAPSDATVLILGETGTGKELIARAIHRRSPRSARSFIKLNCAAIPTGLLESELFGHEKGAFTGAISQKVGRLELADAGTLFLDEVGDIPLELQPKLLRVLQDQEFERLGSTRTIRVNIRLVAATNRDLGKAVSEREFRSDLFYRLNVFPIRMPALRERTGDVDLLVRYFVQKFSRRMNKGITTIPTGTMNALVRWEWPGNVRELENFIERSVILSDGPALTVPLAELVKQSENSCGDGTLESMERQHIVRMLRQTGGVIAGIRGAAIRLG